MWYSIVAAFAALPACINAVALHDFPPRVSNLPAACNSIYTQEISACTPSDFAKGHECSVACVNSLNALSGPILKNCGGISGQNIISAYLNGFGPSSICTDADAILAGGNNDGGGQRQSSSVSQTTSYPPSTSASPSEATSHTTSTDDSSTTTSTSTTSDSSSSSTSGSVAVSGTSTASSAETTTALHVDTSSAPSGAHTQAATQTTELSPQQSLLKDGSGGGSPFDSPGNLRNAAGKIVDCERSNLTRILLAAISILALYIDYQ